jgi:hypothetical protein
MTTSSPRSLGDPEAPAVTTTKLPFGQNAAAVVLLFVGVPILGIGLLGLGAGATGMGIGLGLAGALITGAGLWLRGPAFGVAQVRMYEHGVTVERGKQRHEIPFASVTAFRLEEQEVLSNGTASGRTYRVLLKSAAGEVRFGHRTHADAGADPALRTVALLLDRLADATSERLRGGGVLEGEGWTFGLRGLAVAGATPVPLAQLLPPLQLEDGVAVWRQGRDEALLRRPTGGLNVVLLREVLARLVEAKPEASPRSGPGRLLFEKKGNRSVVAGAALVAGLGLMMAGFALADGIAAIGLAWLAGAGAAVAVGVAVARSRFRCHERAVSSTSVLGQKMLLFEQVESFTHTAIVPY